MSRLLRSTGTRGFGIALIIIIGFLCLMCFWTDSNLEWMLSAMKDEAVEVPMWISIIVTFLLNGVCLAFNIICSLLKLVI